MSVRLAEVIAVLDAAYPPRLAHSWDSVGLVCGDPDEAVESVTVAVDANSSGFGRGLPLPDPLARAAPLPDPLDEPSAVRRETFGTLAELPELDSTLPCPAIGPPAFLAAGVDSVSASSGGSSGRAPSAAAGGAWGSSLFSSWKPGKNVTPIQRKM